MNRRSLLGAALLAAPLPLRAQSSYATRPVRIIVPAVAGGGNDVSVRILAPRMAAALGQTMVVDNRPGGSGNLANELLAQAAPDGQTLLMGTIGSLVTNPLIQRTLPIVPLRDFTLISLAVQVTNILVAPTDRPWRTVAELVATAKAKPGSLSYGSSGVGSAGHLAGALLDQVAGIESVHIPYRGGGQLIADILSGKVDYAFATAATTLEHVRAGRLHGLAVPTAERSALVPDLPTMAEAGVPGYSVLNWYALVGPKGMPAPVVEQVNAALRAALGDAEAVGKLAQQGIEPLPSTPAECARFMAAETAKWDALVKAAHIGQG